LDASAAGFVAFIDDDETASPGWLVELLAMADATGAAAVLGPVRAHYHADAPDWMRKGDFHSTLPVWVQGEIRTGYT
ncbi:glycosyltransferase, partial [Klebsiella pneumoniae]|uniref:glycosyltransferase n=1 Tax=Klebsiella pneumoniae TaxID=573 RepID=UPI0013D76673